MSLDDWSGAYWFTQAVEVPVYLCFARSLNLKTRAAYAFGASTITHPFLWFCLPWTSSPYLPLLIVAETFAVVIEAWWGRWWKIPRPWTASLIANTTSACLGFAVRHVFQA